MSRNKIYAALKVLLAFSEIFAFMLAVTLFLIIFHKLQTWIFQ